VIATGTPEQVAENERSYTGQFLRPLLERDRKRKTSGNGGKGRRGRDDAWQRAADGKSRRAPEASPPAE